MAHAPRRAPRAPGRRTRRDAYTRFASLDGRHPFQRSVPDGYVAYRARRRHDGRVAWLNFALAKEMGLLPPGHPPRLTRALERVLLRTFAIQIVNEWDEQHGTRIPAGDLLPHRYMATRYLQLQHPDRRGGTSGDGRSIWNGCVTHRGVTWDVSSCGTGVTRLCPATAQEKRFFKTGNRWASYGCGTAALEEGLGAALMSEIFHRNGIATERLLTVIEMPGGQGIHVRAATSLIRPSHFFVHLKRGDLPALRAVAELYVERRIANGEWPAVEPDRRFAFLAEEVARCFARAAATFESEYVFCWLDWDGDNVLTDGAILDYGSVRQFGLYHREYRFQDVDRMSTTIPEQRRKARAIVQCFAQIRDALESGRKRPIAAFRRDPVLALFDAELERTKRRLLLRRIGIPPALEAPLLAGASDAIDGLREPFEALERARSSRGPHPVPDGLSWNAVFCMRDLLRELPRRYLEEARWLRPEEMITLFASSYASRRDRRVTPHRARQLRSLQYAYVALLRIGAQELGGNVPRLLAEIVRRSAVINRFDRITGDAVDHATARILRRRRGLSSRALHALIERFVERQDLRPLAPDAWDGDPREPLEPPAEKLLEALSHVVGSFREGL